MKNLFFVLLLLVGIPVFAQNGILSFEKKSINQPGLKADDVPTVVSFKFQNTGTVPVIISKVVVTSTALTVEWPKEPVLPGKYSEIKVSFLSLNIPQRFNYHMNVITNTNLKIRLNLSGNVVDNPDKDDLLYKTEMTNGLKFKATFLSFPRIRNNESLSDTLYYYNKGKESITLGFDNQPEHIKADFRPHPVPPGKKGMLILTFDGSKKNDYGYGYDNLVLVVNGSRNYQNRITITANVAEDFSKLTPQQLAMAPVAYVEKRTVDFGTIKEGEKVDCDFILENKGKTDLYIRKVKPACGCTAVTLGEEKIAPGKSTKIRATFDSAYKPGTQHKSVTVITNDPQAPEMLLAFTGNVTPK